MAMLHPGIGNRRDGCPLSLSAKPHPQSTERGAIPSAGVTGQPVSYHETFDDESE